MLIYIPEGLCPRLLFLSDEAEFVYKCTDVYNLNAEGGIPYDDRLSNVQWPEVDCEIKTSEKDKNTFRLPGRNLNF